MLTPLILFLVSADPASALSAKSYCFTIETDFHDDDGNDEMWPDGYDAPARGAKVVLEWGTNSVDYTLDSDGCQTFYVPESILGYDLTIRARAVVNGVTIESYSESGTTYVIPEYTTRLYYSGTETEISVATSSMSDDDNQAWHNFAVGVFAMNRSTMHWGQHGSCLTHDTWNDYPESSHDNIDSDLLVFYTMSGGSCCGSLWENPPDSLFTGGVGDKTHIPAVGAGYLSKYQIAHELGHVIMMQRIGDREETNYDAPLRGCMGSYTGSYVAADTGASTEKSELTMEWSAAAAREGWAHFYSAWLFNDSTESDCWFNTAFSFQDFDLDGTVENDFTSSVYDHVIDCEGYGIPSSLGLYPDTSHDFTITARDWLLDAWDNEACGHETYPYYPYYTGKSTQYDWMRFWWDMLTDEGIAVETLSDIYVDMCPTTWDKDPQWYDTFDSQWPEWRLENSCDYHDEWDAWYSQRDNGVDHRP